MSDQQVETVADGLRAIMDRKALKLTDLAAATGIPYRSLQNYFSRKTEMPVSVYLKICKALVIDNVYVDTKRFEVDYEALKEALRIALGPLLPRPEFNDQGAMVLMANGDRPRNESDLQRHAGTLAMFVRGHYDIARENAVGRDLPATETKFPQ